MHSNVPTGKELRYLQGTFPKVTVWTRRGKGRNQLSRNHKRKISVSGRGPQTSISAIENQSVRCDIVQLFLRSALRFAGGWECSGGVAGVSLELGRRAAPQGPGVQWRTRGIASTTDYQRRRLKRRVSGGSGEVQARPRTWSGRAGQTETITKRISQAHKRQLQAGGGAAGSEQGGGA